MTLLHLFRRRIPPSRAAQTPEPIDWNARLQRMVDERRNSFEIIDYRKRRAAMLKHTRPDPRLG